MKLRDIFVVITATFVAIAIAAPAQAQIKCKAKVDRKTGVISYSFKYTSAGPVQFAYENYGPPSTHTDQTLYSFPNEDSCQTNGKGKACRVSADPDAAAIAPARCKTYMYDETDDTTCETRVPYCQVATRPVPTTGYYCIENNHETTAVWDAATGHAWHISSAHQPRSLDDHHEHLKHLNGTHVDLVGDPDHTPLVHSADLELPTLHQLKHLAQDCADLFNEIGGVAGTPTSAQECLHTLCLEVWPDPADPDNCAWSRTADATQPNTHGHAVCLVDTGGVSRARDCFGSICAEASPREVGQGDAAETAVLTRNQILQQASIAALAQANPVPQQVLSLLQ